MRPLVACTLFSLWLWACGVACVQAQSRPLSSDEKAVLEIVLDSSSPERDQLCERLAERPSPGIITRLCEKASSKDVRDVALDSLEKIDPAYGNAVRVLVTGGDCQARLKAIETLRDYGYVGSFASPALRVEAERGGRLLRSLNANQWRQIDEMTLSGIENYKFSLWMLARCDSTAEIRDYLLSELDFQVDAIDASTRQKVESLLFADGEASLMQSSQRNEWQAGCFSAISHFAASARPLRTKIVERLIREFESPSAIRQIQACRSLITCGANAKSALPTLRKLSEEGTDQRVRNTARDAAAMIEGRVEAAKFAGDGNNFELLVRMLAEGDNSPSRLEALELIALHHVGCYRFANEMFRSSVDNGHYQRLRTLLIPANFQNVPPGELGVMLDLHTTHLLNIEAFVIDAVAEDAERQRLESQNVIAKMELAEHQLKLLSRIFAFEQQYINYLASLDALTSASDAQLDFISQKIMENLTRKQHPGVQAKLEELLFVRIRRNLMVYVLSHENNAQHNIKVLQEHRNLMELLKVWAQSSPEKTQAICDHLFSDLHLLYIGGPGTDTGHSFDQVLVDLYIKTLRSTGDYPKIRAEKYRVMAQEAQAEQRYSAQILKQIGRYNQEVMVRLRVN